MVQKPSIESHLIVVLPWSIAFYDSNSLESRGTTTAIPDYIFINTELLRGCTEQWRNSRGFISRSQLWYRRYQDLAGDLKNMQYRSAEHLQSSFWKQETFWKIRCEYKTRGCGSREGFVGERGCMNCQTRLTTFRYGSHWNFEIARNETCSACCG